MNPMIIGIVGIAFLVVLLLLRMPVAFSMLVAAVIGFSYLRSPIAGLALLSSDLFGQLSSYSFSVVPMFILAGSFAYVSGIGERLFSGAYALFGRLPGSLAIAVTVGCAAFGAVCGSSSACIAAMGRISIPIMKTYKYDDALATGCVAAAGNLAVTIPPSTPLMVYGILTEQSIGKLFIAGVLPGILLTILFSMTVAILVIRNPKLAPAGPPTTAKQKREGFVGAGETIVIFLIVVGGLFYGLFSPTQGGGILAVAMLVLSLARRKISREGFVFALKDTLRITCMVMLIIASGIIFGRFVAVTNVPFAISHWLVALNAPPVVVIILVLVVYAIGGCFMDSMALLILGIPIIFPTIVSLGYDPIWFGVIMLLAGEMGVLTPPVGLNVFVTKGLVPDIPMSTIYKGIWPFVGAIVVCMVILIAFPRIVTFLPSFMTY